MSTPAIACAIGPGSPDWMASTAVRADSSSKAARGDANVRPTTSGASTVSIRRARCSAPHAGKLHHASPQPNAPSPSSTRTSTAGRSCMTPNEVRTGTRTGQRSTCTSTRAMAGSGERWLSRLAMGIRLRYKGMVDSTFVTLQPQARNPLHRAALIAAPWLAIVALWYAVRASGLVNPSLVPAPHAVLAKFVELAKRPARARRLDVDAARLRRRLPRRARRRAGRLRDRLVPQRSHLRRPAHQLLPRPAADRADPARHRLLRHRRGGEDGDPLLRLVLRRRDRDGRGHRPDQPDLRARGRDARRERRRDLRQGDRAAHRAAHPHRGPGRARRRLGDAGRLRADRRAAGSRRADPERVVVLPARHHLRRHHLHRPDRAGDGPALRFATRRLVAWQDRIA